MDTRDKILSLPAARELREPMAVATGTFNPLRARHARELAQFREQTAGYKLLAVVLPAEPELLPARARAELAAGLRAVDYVVIADGPAELVRLLRPAAVLELNDSGWTQDLVDCVRVKASTGRR